MVETGSFFRDDPGLSLTTKHADSTHHDGGSDVFALLIKCYDCSRQDGRGLRHVGPGDGICRTKSRMALRAFKVANGLAADDKWDDSR
jgi:hypothetical protein